MRIPLTVSPIGRISTVVSIHAPRCSGFVTFVIDTGSPYTFFSERDAERLKIPMSALKPDTALVGLGGKKFNLLVFRRGKFNFRTELGTIYTISWPIRLRSYAERSKYVYAVEEFPSILGTDLMKENKFILHYDPAKNAAYFEVEKTNNRKKLSSNI